MVLFTAHPVLRPVLATLRGLRGRAICLFCFWGSLFYDCALHHVEVQLRRQAHFPTDIVAKLERCMNSAWIRFKPLNCVAVENLHDLMSSPLPWHQGLRIGIGLGFLMYICEVQRSCGPWYMTDVVDLEDMSAVNRQQETS